MSSLETKQFVLTNYCTERGVISNLLLMNTTGGGLKYPSTERPESSTESTQHSLTKHFKKSNLLFHGERGKKITNFGGENIRTK